MTSAEKLEAKQASKNLLSDNCHSISILDLLFLCIFKLQKLLLPIKYFKRTLKQSEYLTIFG